jgi:two-component system, LytTR family, response regulator
MKAWPFPARRDQPAVGPAAALPAVLVGRTAGWLAECRRSLARVPEVEVRAAGRCLADLNPLLGQLAPAVALLDPRLLAEEAAAAFLPLVAAKPLIIYVGQGPETEHSLLASLYPVLPRPLEPRRLRPLLGLGSAPVAEPRILLAEAGRRELVAKVDVVAIRSDGDYTRIWVEGAKPYVMLRPLHAWEHDLRSARFLRLDRFLLVNPRHIVGLVPEPALGRVLLRLAGGPTLPLSRAGVRRVKQWLQQPAAAGG